MLSCLDRIVQTTVTTARGNEPIPGGRIAFRSASLTLEAKDKLLGGFTYGLLATAIRGLGELMYDYGENGVYADVYASGRLVGSMDLDIVI